MAMPLNVGIDHVSMQLSFSRRGDAALSLIDELAVRDERGPVDPAMAALLEELRSDGS
jgi:hypothetical protein